MLKFILPITISIFSCINSFDDKTGKDEVCFYFNDKIKSDLGSLDKNEIETLVILFACLYINEKNYYEIHCKDLMNSIDYFISDLGDEMTFYNEETIDKERIEKKSFLEELKEYIDYIKTEINQNEKLKAIFKMFAEIIQERTKGSTLYKASEIQDSFCYTMSLRSSYEDLLAYYYERFKEDFKLVLKNDPFFKNFNNYLIEE